MPKNILEVKGLKTDFRSEHGILRAVDNVSFELKAGETLGIVGESGSGKSVTSLSIMQLISYPGEISAGEIIYTDSDGASRDLLKLSSSEMRKYRGKELAMIFQEPMTSLNPVFTCGDQILEAIVLHQDLSKINARKRTLELLAQVQLPDPNRIFRSYPHQLSGGQKQRVMIAMAMSCNPGLLIADEPTTALDVTVQKTILELMANLSKDNGMSVLFITHDLGVIAEIADRVLVMYKGKIVESGLVSDVFDNPQHPYTKGLLACRPPLNTRLTRLPVIEDFMREELNSGISAESDSVETVVNRFKLKEQDWQNRQDKLRSKEPILKVENLSTWFANGKTFTGRVKDYVKAVDDVSFDVYPGETLGLVGESGCGKTTLGRTILRLQNAKEGKVIFEGRDILTLPSKEMKLLREEMQIIFQDPYSSLNPRMTVGEAILEPMKVHGIGKNNQDRKDKVIELLRKVNLSAIHYGRYPHEFSGGQRQRVCIARSLALNPRFIICDESVSALDVSVQAQVLNLLISLREEFGFTFIFISHDLSVVKFMSDRMIVMNKGKIVEIGESDQIYNNPQTEYTKQLISAIPKGRKSDFLEQMNSNNG